jgi:hypothetical protein
MSVTRVNLWIVHSHLCAFHCIGFVTPVSLRTLPWTCISCGTLKIIKLDWEGQEKGDEDPCSLWIGFFHKIGMPSISREIHFWVFSSLSNKREESLHSNSPLTISSVPISSIVNMFKRWEGIQAWKVWSFVTWHLWVRAGGTDNVTKNRFQQSRL